MIDLDQIWTNLQSEARRRRRDFELNNRDSYAFDLLSSQTHGVKRAVAYIFWYEDDFDSVIRLIRGLSLGSSAMEYEVIADICSYAMEEFPEEVVDGILETAIENGGLLSKVKARLNAIRRQNF